MDYYSGAPEPMDEYNENMNYNSGGSFFKKNSFILLIILAIIIAGLLVVFFVVGDFSKPDYKELDDDSYLSELNVSGGVISPDFVKDKFEYTVVANSEYVTFECKKSSKKAKVQGCDEAIQVTDKEIVHSIRVEAEDTNVSKYYITIKKGKEEVF